MTKSPTREVTWRLFPDREPDAEPITRQMVCVVCDGDGEDDGKAPDATSAPFEDGKDGVLAAQSWVFAHVSRHPCHHTYREIIRRPWRAVMT
ncbi:hypothetical protein [Streptomyces sp. PA5.6]|uniref:DUF7848 domain-containing protein n=1 Tax=Streptomyces sp. PA5.6 TaxID=3035651 RepID=UPI003904D8B2